MTTETVTLPAVTPAFADAVYRLAMQVGWRNCAKRIAFGATKLDPQEEASKGYNERRAEVEVPEPPPMTAPLADRIHARIGDTVEVSFEGRRQPAIFEGWEGAVNDMLPSVRLSDGRVVTLQSAKRMAGVLERGYVPEPNGNGSAAEQTRPDPTPASKLNVPDKAVSKGTIAEACFTGCEEHAPLNDLPPGHEARYVDRWLGSCDDCRELTRRAMLAYAISRLPKNGNGHKPVRRSGVGHDWGLPGSNPPRNAAGGWSVPNPGGYERQWGKLIGVGIYGWGYRGKVTPCRMGDPAGIH